MKRSLFLILIIPIIFSCTRAYQASDFEQKTQEHKVIAVLPVEMIFTGTKPKNMTPEMEKELMEGESRAFQLSLFNEILKKSNIKGGYRIDFQPVDKTNTLLSQNNISIQDAWTKDPQELSQILGVDAVVKAKIQKTRYMSDLASYGVQVGRDVLNVLLSPTNAFIFNPGGNAAASGKTYDINASYSVVDGDSGVMLWNINATRQADWNYPAHVAIDGINSQCARKFPYRVKS